MNLEIENSFVEKYIKKEYQERLKHELMKKREKALSRFSHNAFELLKKNLTIVQVKDENSILTFEAKSSIHEECYLISRFYDGMVMKFNVALKELFEDLCTSILVSNDFTIIKEETEKGQPNIYLIKAN
ncbi:MAG: hypothetical protein K2J85_03165 [Anaeroplasmataceae bacterium]|nr:hypothetical protein [Anaeroplasmataceae bacterium]